MALTFAKYEPVNFGGLEVMPVITTERKLRAQNINLSTQAGQEEAAHILADFFEGHADEVEEFIKHNMGANDISELLAYLVGGPKAAVRIDQAINDNMREALRVKHDEK